MADAKHAHQLSDLIDSIFPQGTNGKGAGKIRKIPIWPPDLFAASAILLQRTGVYGHNRFFDLDACVKGKQLKKARRCGQRIRRGSISLKSQQAEWRAIIQAGSTEITDEFSLDLYNSKPPRWMRSAMKLLHIADVSCAGIGFGIASKSASRINREVHAAQQRAYYQDHVDRSKRVVDLVELEDDYERVKHVLDNLTKRAKVDPNIFADISSSVCKFVPTYVACVQPKALTPRLGQTIRSFSHNLALLPPTGEVRTFWNNLKLASQDPAIEPHAQLEESQTLNILAIPYPYRFTASCFAESVRKTTHKSSKRFFEVKQRWLSELGSEAEQVVNLSNGIIELIKRAQDQATSPDIIVLPELALTHELAERVSYRIMDFARGIEKPLKMFISGVISERRSTSGEETDFTTSSFSPDLINSVYTNAATQWHQVGDAGLQEVRIPVRRLQTKHHRWCLDAVQLKHYNLASALSPERLTYQMDRDRLIREPSEWWERTSTIYRECLFWVLDGRLVVSTVICEDLARIEPVQEVLRAVAPNLTFALLMDGPQHPARWSGRYAMSLSDDPGSCVLTLTSVGMIRRDSRAVDSTSSAISLWRDGDGETKVLELPQGAHAMLLTLTSRVEQARTASNWLQDEVGLSRRLELASTHVIRGNCDLAMLRNA